MANKYTDSNKYKPTTAEKKLLEVLLDPVSTQLSVTDICERAGVARRTYYKATAKEEFNNLVKESALDMIKGKVAPLMNAAYKYALEEKGHQDRKMLFNMLGMYADKIEEKVDINSVDGVKIKIVDD